MVAADVRVIECPVCIIAYHAVILLGAKIETPKPNGLERSLKKHVQTLETEQWYIDRGKENLKILEKLYGVDTCIIGPPLDIQEALKFLEDSERPDAGKPPC